jgi:hypothetical protein
MTLIRSLAEALGWICLALWLGGSLNAWEVLVYIGPRHSITTTSTTTPATQPERPQRHGTTPTF